MQKFASSNTDGCSELVLFGCTWLYSFVLPILSLAAWTKYWTQVTFRGNSVTTKMTTRRDHKPVPLQVHACQIEYKSNGQTPFWNPKIHFLGSKKSNPQMQDFAELQSGLC